MITVEWPNLRNHQKMKLEGPCQTIYTSITDLKIGLRKKKKKNQKIPEFYHRSFNYKMNTHKHKDTTQT